LRFLRKTERLIKEHFFAWLPTSRSLVISSSRNDGMAGFKWSGVLIKGLARVRHKAVKTVNLLAHQHTECLSCAYIPKLPGVIVINRERRYTRENRKPQRVVVLARTPGFIDLHHTHYSGTDRRSITIIVVITRCVFSQELKFE